MSHPPSETDHNIDSCADNAGVRGGSFSGYDCGYRWEQASPDARSPSGECCPTCDEYGNLAHTQ